MRSDFVARLALAGALWLGASLPARAQWQTQSILVKPGWTAVYLHVDPSYTNLDGLVSSAPANAIAEVWLWQPAASSIQYVTSPQAPTTGSSQWSVWTRTNSPAANTLGRLVANAAYLVHSVATTNFTWTIKGRPVTPSYLWTSTGINLIGFPTVTNNAPLLDNFLSLAPDLQSQADIYQYVGGELGPSNPMQVFSPHTVTVTRGQAFWVRAGSYFNNYFGPFQVALGDPGIAFGDANSRYSFHLRNTTPFPVTVQLRLAPSETPPAGQTPVLGVPPLVARGTLSSTNLTYAVSNLSTSDVLSWTLAPNTSTNGSDIVVVLGVNRQAFANSAPGLYAGILKFTDASNFTEVDVPVSAQPSSYAGLWVGSAAVSQVANYLKIFQRDSTNGLVLDANGADVVTGINTNLGNASTAFLLRLILHNDGTNVVLLQRVFYGLDTYSNLIVSTSESKLDPAQLGTARRISSVQFPWTANNQTWPVTNSLSPGSTLTVAVPLPYDDQASNPFLHTYHPDHDNLDASFKNQQPIGAESYGINRNITLQLSSPGSDFNSLTQFGQTFQGNYAETITMTGLNQATRTFNVAGAFAINRISPIAVLTRP